MKSTTRVFTETDGLIALVIISFIVALPAGVFAAPDTRAQSGPDIMRVMDSLRQISETAALWQKTGGCSDRECTNAGSLAAAGKLDGTLQAPAGAGIAGQRFPEYTTTLSRMGGCGPASPGAPRTLNPALYFVSEEFCLDYNKSAGLGGTIVKNCGSGGNCTSGSTQSYEFPTVNSTTFCYQRDDIYAIVWIGTISGAPCPTY